MCSCRRAGAIAAGGGIVSVTVVIVLGTVVAIEGAISFSIAPSKAIG